MLLSQVFQYLWWVLGVMIPVGKRWVSLWTVHHLNSWSIIWLLSRLEMMVDAWDLALPRMLLIKDLRNSCELIEMSRTCKRQLILHGLPLLVEYICYCLFYEWPMTQIVEEVDLIIWSVKLVPAVEVMIQVFFVEDYSKGNSESFKVFQISSYIFSWN